MAWRRSLTAGVALIAGAARAAADPLPPPLPLPASTVIAPSDPGCGLAAPKGDVHAVRLFVRNSHRRIGPYDVVLPGYAADETDQGADAYRPYLIEAKPGDTLSIDLVNQLAQPNEVNLHTHGLVTPPRPYSRPCNLPGDFIFNAAEPGRDLVYRIDIPKTVIGIGDDATPKNDGDGDADDANPFPTGVYWLHTHIHGAAKNGVWAGQAALLDIETATPQNPVDAAKAGFETKYVALRELQLAVPLGRYPDAIGETLATLPPNATMSDTMTASWIDGDDYDPTACQDEAHRGQPTFHGPGYCAKNGAPGVTDNSKDTLWLFTVNGAIAPDIAIDSGKTQLWKIANLSSVVTYVLDISTPNCTQGCEEKPFQVVKIDGVATSTAAPAVAAAAASPPKRTPGVEVKRLFLPPAARAEILVANDETLPADKSMVLRTIGFESGGVGQSIANYNGDPWPKIDLATVTLKAGGETASTLQDFLKTAFAVNHPRGSQGPAPRSYAAVAPAIPHDCVTLSDSRMWRRRITLNQDDTTFKIGSEVLDADDNSAPADENGLSPTIAPVQFEHGAPTGSIPHVCAKLGTEEIWEVINVTNEMHNFHLHQTKFRLASVADKARFPVLAKLLKTDADAFQDPGDVIGSQVGAANGLPAVKGVDVWHDTLPVAPATFDSTGAMIAPGRIIIRIPFQDPNQIGTYVFHCHILEHEDKGMMAEVEVYDPKDPEATSKRAAIAPRSKVGNGKLAYCGAPPANAAAYAIPAVSPDRRRGFWESLRGIAE